MKYNKHNQFFASFTCKDRTVSVMGIRRPTEKFIDVPMTNEDGSYMLVSMVNPTPYKLDLVIAVKHPNDLYDDVVAESILMRRYKNKEYHLSMYGDYFGTSMCSTIVQHEAEFLAMNYEKIFLNNSDKSKN